MTTTLDAPKVPTRHVSYQTLARNQLEKGLTKLEKAESFLNSLASESDDPTTQRLVRDAKVALATLRNVEGALYSSVNYHDGEIQFWPA